jgi:hypothetical protein
MRTGRYRVRRGWFGRSVLQEYLKHPETVDTYESYEWVDVRFRRAPPALVVDPTLHRDPCGRPYESHGGPT